MLRERGAMMRIRTQCYMKTEYDINSYLLHTIMNRIVEQNHMIMIPLLPELNERCKEETIVH